MKISLSYNEIVKRINKNLLYEPKPLTYDPTKESRYIIFLTFTKIGDMLLILVEL